MYFKGLRASVSIFGWQLAISLDTVAQVGRQWYYESKHVHVFAAFCCAWNLQVWNWWLFNIFQSVITVQQNVYIFVILPIALTLTRPLLLILISGEFVPKTEERIRIQKDKSVLVLVEWKTVCSAFLAGGGICTLNPDPNHIFTYLFGVCRSISQIIFEPFT